MLSPDSARRAEAAGYTNVRIFHEGMPAWKKAGNLVVSEPESLKEFIGKDISHVLVDLRPAKQAAAGHIQGAFSVPAESLASAKERFPADKSAPIILYGEGIPAEAFRTVRGWGYKDTTLLNGGIASWQKIGGLLLQGEMPSSIVYVWKPRPGEVLIEDFKNYVEKKDPGVLILDVRDKDEAMNGMLRGAINIPASEIQDRAKELPKDKLIVTHCVTGIRAESAYEDLKELGFKNIKFLNAVIQIDKDGKYEITKK